MREPSYVPSERYGSLATVSILLKSLAAVVPGLGLLAAIAVALDLPAFEANYYYVAAGILSIVLFATCLYGAAVLIDLLVGIAD